jgi:hypothetical protein
MHPEVRADQPLAAEADAAEKAQMKLAKVAEADVQWDLPTMVDQEL